MSDPRNWHLGLAPGTVMDRRQEATESMYAFEDATSARSRFDVMPESWHPNCIRCGLSPAYGPEGLCVGCWIETSDKQGDDR